MTHMGEHACKGLVVLVGAGPGDAELITLAGARWLSDAEVVVYDRLANPALLDLAPATAQRVYVGKGRQGQAMTQEQINALLVELGRAGRRVVRLKGGDPFLFGRGGEEAAALAAAGVPFRVVPGVTAAAGATAYAGIPLTDRTLASSVALVTGQEDPSREQSRVNWSALAGIDTVVFYMGVKNLPEIAERLMAAGKSGRTPTAIIERGTTAGQRVVSATLATIVEAASRERVGPPSLIVVGEVVKLRERFDWRSAMPLAGQTILVTRSRQQASALVRRLAELGAEVIEAPTIAIEPPTDFAPIDAALRRLAEYDTVCFTSANGVEAFFARAMKLGLDARALAGRRVAAVGAATAAALRERFLLADLIPEAYTADALADALTALGDLAGRRVLLARADIARASLREALLTAGAAVDDVPFYRTVRPPALAPAAEQALRQGRADWVTFTSSSTVENFLALLASLGDADPAELLRSVRLASIGPVTSDTMRKRGLSVAAEADPHDVPHLVEAIVAARQRGQG